MAEPSAPSALPIAVSAPVPPQPPVIARQLFAAFNQDEEASISLEAFICSVAIVAHGTVDERAAFAFAFLDTRRTASVSVAQLRFMYEQLYGKRRVSGRSCKDHIEDVLETLPGAFGESTPISRS